MFRRHRRRLRVTPHSVGRCREATEGTGCSAALDPPKALPLESAGALSQPLPKGLSPFGIPMFARQYIRDVRYLRAAKLRSAYFLANSL